jgi:pyrroloquinoline quinone biosynthesis protein B
MMRNIDARPVPRFILVLMLHLASLVTVHAAESGPYLYVLGVAQDAGYPQAGCYEPHCMPGWQDPKLRRGATSVALVVPESSKKYLFEATPHLPSELFFLEQEASSDDYEFAGIFLTHAHIGHYAGLMYLGHEAMGASGVPVYAMPRMTEFLKSNGPWSQLVAYENIALQALEDRSIVPLGSVDVTPFLVPHRDEFSETVGFHIVGPEKSAIFIPDIDKWSEWDTDIVDIATSVDYALIDATFFADGELPGRDMSVIRHPFVTESMAALEGLTAEDRGRVWFIHMNHTNPLLDGNSDESARVRAAGFNIASEGVRFEL